VGHQLSLFAKSSNRPCVAIVLPRGEAIRNFVYTGTLDELAKFAEVVVFSVFPNTEIRILIEGRCHRLIELRQVRERWLVRFIREVLDIAHGRFLWSEAAKERWRLRDLEAKTFSSKVKRWAKKFLGCSFAHQRGLAVLSNLESSLSYLLRTTNYYVDLLKEFRPSLVFNGSHVHSAIALPVIHAAGALGIPTATFIFSWDNLTSQGRIIPPYDYYFVWNETIRNQLLSIYPFIRSQRIFVTGTPQFDFHFRSEFYWTREEFCTRVGADPSRPIVLYTTGMANHMPGEPRIVEGIADMLRGMKPLGPPQLLVRVYPKDQTDRFEDLKKRRSDILFPQIPWEPAWLTPMPEDCCLFTNMLRHADLGIDKPVINVGYNPPGLDVSPVDYGRYYEFDHYKPVVESGAVRVAWSEYEMQEAIEEALLFPERRSLERKALIERFFGEMLDGRSGQRVAETLLKLALLKRESP
jgi:hypothetical protein